MGVGATFTHFLIKCRIEFLFKSLSVVHALQVLTLGYLGRSTANPVGDADVVRVIRGGSIEVINLNVSTAISNFNLGTISNA